jgi:hypothetical protein
MTAPVNRYYVLQVQASGERAPHIRSILAAHLRYWGLEPHIQPVCRAVHELFLNVAEHAGDDRTCIVELRWNGRFLTAAVSDRAPLLPRLLGPSRGGLATVAALSDTWGAWPTADGKIVWFTRRATCDDIRHIPARGPARAMPAATRAPDGVPS